MTRLVDDAVILVIDMVKDALDEGGTFEMPAGRDMFDKTAALLELGRANKIPTVYAASHMGGSEHLEHFWWQIREGIGLVGGPGVEIADALRPAQYSDHEVYLPKWKYSAFYGTKLDVILSNPPFRGRRTMIITGMATNFCCLTTTIDAFNREYDVLFVEDLNCTFDGIDGTPAETMHKVTVETIKQGYAAVTTADSLLERLKQETSVPAGV